MAYKKKDKEAELHVKHFIKAFHEKFGIIPRVTYSFEKHTHNISINELEEAVNGLIHTDLNIDFPATIRTKNRKRELVLYRQCAFKIAIDLGYGCSLIGSYFGWDHATVIHSCKIIKELTNTRDSLAIKTLTKIENELEKRYGVNGILPSDSEAAIDA
jgi:chromosomal replication initiation ATPase DnaA